MRKIIVNSTPLIALAKANKLEILKGLYEHIIIPEAVYREVTEKDDVAAQRIEAAKELFKDFKAFVPDGGNFFNRLLCERPEDEDGEGA